MDETIRIYPEDISTFHGSEEIATIGAEGDSSDIGEGGGEGGGSFDRNCIFVARSVACDDTGWKGASDMDKIDAVVSAAGDSEEKIVSGEIDIAESFAATGDLCDNEGGLGGVGLKAQDVLECPIYFSIEVDRPAVWGGGEAAAYGRNQAGR